MTNCSCNISRLQPITPIKRQYYKDNATYKSYLPDENLVPPFLPLGNNKHQVRINASTHNLEGVIKKGTPEAMDNTARLKHKVENCFNAMKDIYDLDDDKDSNTLIVTYGISSEAARDAVRLIRKDKQKISLLLIKGLLPVSQTILDVLKRYENIIVVEENISGLLKEILYGQIKYDNIRSVNKFGHLISPSEIIKEVNQCIPV